MQRIKQEKLVIEEFHKIKAQQHLYIRAYVTTERSFLMNNGAGFLQFHENNSTDPPIVSIEQVLKTQKLGEYLKSYAERHNVPLNLLRAWNLANRRHGDVRLDIPFTEEHLDLCKLDLVFKNQRDIHLSLSFSSRRNSLSVWRSAIFTDIHGIC